MKKTIAVALGALLAGTAAFCGACAKDKDRNTYTVYAPDGAPALALAELISDDADDRHFDVNIVDASTIQTFVTGETPKADFCILPVNLAAKTIGTGTVYEMLGTVTNGNLFFLTTGERPTLTCDNLKETLVGKKVGVVQLANVPGLTLQVVLNQYGIPYETIESADAAASSDKVSLIAFDPKNVTPAGKCDYYLCPEPAATTKIGGTASAPMPFSMAGDLQALYGTGGYPQAVLVAKKSVIDGDRETVREVIDDMKESAEFLAETAPETLVSLLDGKRTAGLDPSFTVNNLNRTVISNCSVRFTEAKNCKEAVVAFLDKLIAVNANAAAKPLDAFFYLG